MTLERGETATDIRRTPDGRRLVVRRAVGATREAVWDVLVDTDQWSAWGPSITAVESSDERIRRGTQGRVRALGAVWLTFEITTCENYRWTWDVAGIEATGHFVEPHPAGAVVGFEMPVVAVGYVPVCRRACTRIGKLAGRRGSDESA